MKTMHDWFEFQAMLEIQWETELYEDILHIMAVNDESPSDFQTIEVEEDMDWVGDYGDIDETYRPIITDFYIFTKKYCYTFLFNTEGEKDVIYTPRNPLNDIPFGIRSSKYGNEVEVEKHVVRLNKLASQLEENKN